jgi:thiol-disulfide isomerase/thioredoxin
MLLLPAQWDRAFVVDLQSGMVTAHTRSEVVAANGHVHAPPEGSGEPAGTAVPDSDGRLCLSNGDWELVVEAAPPLVGPLEREELIARQPAYGRRVHAYEPDPGMVDIIAAFGEPLEILAFFGTWCSTCKEHLPALFAVLDQAGNERIRITCVGVDENFAEPADLLFTHDVQATPTFVVMVDGFEIGRIEDEPHASIEADLAGFLLDWEAESR